MLPITTGVIPFGLVMGTVGAKTQLSLLQLMTMNITIFAGASQLAAVDLMGQQIPALVVIITGVIINLRHLLYSAAMSVPLKREPLWMKMLFGYVLTDQSYSLVVAEESHFKSESDRLLFYFGSALVMVSAWQISVLCGFLFGNVAPQSLSLDFAVPLSFTALVLPTIKDKS